ncbi:DUF2179 domain-containing protein [Pseudodesulfovibrio tunisiensis]|uniref:DUF2179 domain-containing protein n=1 Tax=Pseudodesulfovibrio tunisiensis TaxID=463192 RepID=UPI001FB22FA4|nr:DUF5698 domain-containing protein [Pseudodesulfovibrio tunisiensis]
MFDFLDVYPWLLPGVIFLGRIADVSLGTLRIIFVSKGEKNIAPLIGFVEIFIWVVIIAQVFSRANDMFSYLSYAAGYAVGTYIGLHLEAKIGFGFIKYRVFTIKNGLALIAALNKHGFGSTLVHGKGSTVEIDIVEAVVRRKDMKPVEDIVMDFDSKAFCVVEDVRAKQLGIFARRQSLLKCK